MMHNMNMNQMQMAANQNAQQHQQQNYMMSANGNAYNGGGQQRKRRNAWKATFLAVQKKWEENTSKSDNNDSESILLSKYVKF
jgi:hypothetical protein